MLRSATKDTYERENDEAERLVRPSPKVKPPRRDKRRERIDSDPEEERDKDLSLNYKDVGGAVLRRFLAEKSKGKVKVIKKDTGETTYIKPETLKDRPEDYVLPEAGEAAEWSPEDLAAHGKGKALWEQAQGDPELQSIFRDLVNPKSQGAGYLARSTPGFPAGPMMRGRALPDGVENLGQLLKVLEQGQKTPPKPKDEPKPETPSAEETAPSTSAGDEPVAEAPPEKGEEEKAEPEPEKNAPEDQPEKPKEEKGKKPSGEKKPGKVPEPERRKPEDWELMASRSAILETLPKGEMRDRLIDARLHPDDVSEILATYHTAKSADLGQKGAEKLIDHARNWFEPDPSKIGTPKFGKDRAGNEKPFEELNPEEKAEATVHHRNRTVALSLAAHDQVTRSLTKNLGAPPALADFLSAFMLGQKPPKEGAPPPDPAEVDAKSRALSKKVFEKVLAGGQDETVSPNAIKNVIDFTKDDPTAQRAAVAYFQARDYQAAREKWLNPSSPNAISEHQGPTDISRGLVEGSRYLVDRSRLYPAVSVTQDPAGAFRNRVLQHIKTLVPEKYPFVRKHVDVYEHQLYDSEVKRHEKIVNRVMDRYQKDVRRVLDKHDRAVEKIRGKHEQTIDTYKDEAKAYDKEYRKYVKEKIRHQKLVQEALQKDKGEDYRESPTEGLPEPPKAPTPPKPPPDINLPDVPPLPPEPLLPEAPAKPVRYGLADDDLDEERERLWEEQKRQASSYPSRKAMGLPNREAVYWGVDPYPPESEAHGAYPEWSQAHARDLGEKDFSGLLKSAREWLRTPILSKAVEGIEKDTQLRAALDLAIRSHEGGRYSVGLHPQLYNQLLARLAGKSEDETLTTVRAAITRDSVYVVAGDKTMSASAQVRKFATSIAASNPDVAYDLVGLADHLAQEEQQQAKEQQAQQKQGGEVPPQFLEHQKKKEEEKGQDHGQGQQSEQQKQAGALAYRTLKASVLNAAKLNPAIRNALHPVLQTIKQLG